MPGNYKIVWRYGYGLCSKMLVAEMHYCASNKVFSQIFSKNKFRFSLAEYVKQSNPLRAMHHQMQNTHLISKNCNIYSAQHTTGKEMRKHLSEKN